MLTRSTSLLASLAAVALLVACRDSRELPSAPSITAHQMAADRSAVPSPRGLVVFVHDPLKDRSLLVGGISNSDLCSDLACAAGLIDDLWSFNGRSRSWTQLASVLPPRVGDAGAFDSRSRHIIMLQPFFSDIAETWAYDVDTRTWENRHPAVAPPGRVGSAMVYDVAADRVVLYGGSNLSDLSGLQDLWAYEYQSNTWTELHPPVSPPTREFQAMVYVPTLRRTVVFGGHNQEAGTLLNDLWVYDSRRNRWTNLNPKDPPAPRVFAAMAFEQASNRLVLFGGTLAFTLDPGYAADDTWIYDVADNEWTRVFPRRSPSPRGWVAATSTRSGVVVFGGGPAGNQFTNETFVYDARANAWTAVGEEDDKTRNP